ncbi:hypothetical protein C273_02413 [Staphylococcus massiliensis S46]|uniref:Uncharacterized protein n=1 Tax=Staphylococcus massiliensis S46 TaxID=1229783 RepID=K9B8I9_9STAP|nr:hypothetical protein C273_02413 [Staphylococcus massiliensis S46]
MDNETLYKSVINILLVLTIINFVNLLLNPNESIKVTISLIIFVLIILLAVGSFIYVRMKS